MGKAGLSHSCPAFEGYRVLGEAHAGAQLQRRAICLRAWVLRDQCCVDVPCSNESEVIGFCFLEFASTASAERFDFLGTLHLLNSPQA